MHETFMAANSLLFLALWLISIALLYYIIKVAVRNGVEQANARLVESIRRIENDVHEINTKKESS